jgi:hypothetical protein
MRNIDLILVLEKIKQPSSTHHPDVAVRECGGLE